ncbi:hypothetical protein [Nitrospirillum iridis]|uniref:Uncharacterized protein n=1 Tax=Nitrospirillum iridis TaxID=765888 RepID=A0A7X0AYT9_9PROT|nr:hypothetical protein [Nitrospirillum iridis]MBB6252257.1 hypothetical protein [Nitrospirillum iridis]
MPDDLLITPRDSLPQPAPLEGLSAGERLLVWSLRHMAQPYAGHAASSAGRGCPLIRHAFLHACGEDADEVMATFRAFLLLYGRSARQRPQVGCPGCQDLTTDERQLLRLLALAQPSTDPTTSARLYALTEHLMRPGSTEGVLVASRAMASALGAHGLSLPLRPMGMHRARPIGRYDA